MIDFGLKNKICLITGGSRGIGQSMVDAFLKQEAQVISVARSATAVKCEGRYYPYDCDLFDKKSAEDCCDSIINKIGLPDIIIHNLGGSCQITADFPSSDDWVKVWQLNLGISVDINNKFLPLLIHHKKPARIIHVSSSAVKTSAGYAPYTASKAALNSYIKIMALKFSKYNILINAISPGAVKLVGRYFFELEKKDPFELNNFLDQHVAIGRLAEPAEISAVALFLASALASYITGAIIDIDGGMH